MIDVHIVICQLFCNMPTLIWSKIQKVRRISKTHEIWGEPAHEQGKERSHTCKKNKNTHKTHIKHTQNAQ